MNYCSNTIDIFALKSIKGIGNAWINKYFKLGFSTRDMLNLAVKQSKEPIDLNELLNNALYRIKTLGLYGYCDGAVALGDEAFPRFQGHVKESEQPVLLFYKGDISLLNNNNNISVIGLLNPSNEIESRERAFVDILVKYGCSIISGLAKGCDSIAHNQTLESGGKTIAILPSSLGNILPKSNEHLAQAIVDKGGLLVTEYASDHKTLYELNSRYVQRDRLQAMYCKHIILTASYSLNSAKIWNISNMKLDCGSRLAMNYAKSYGISRAVMYNHQIDVSNPMFDLNREILSEPGIDILTPNFLKRIANNVSKDDRELGLFNF